MHIMGSIYTQSGGSSMRTAALALSVTLVVVSTLVSCSPPDSGSEGSKIVLINR